MAALQCFIVIVYKTVYNIIYLMLFSIFNLFLTSKRSDMNKTLVKMAHAKIILSLFLLEASSLEALEGKI